MQNAALMSRTVLILNILKAGWVEKSHIELSEVEEPKDRGWTVEIMI